jgi:PAT family beta-lactamase induction signal transducer AmpG
VSLSSLKKRLGIPYVWAFTTYFTEGFPYTYIRSISSLFFRDMGVKLESIGLTSLYGLPWVFNFLWGPIVDKYETKRRWMLAVQALLTGLMLTVALCSPFDFAVPAIAVLFFVGSIFAATQDVSIDGYYMEALDRPGQAKFVGYRVMAYRIAMMTGTGVIATLGTTVNWFTAFVASACIFGLFFVYHIFFLPHAEERRTPVRILARTLMRLRVLLIGICAAAAIIGVRLFYTSAVYEGIREAHPFLKKIYFSHWVAIGLLIALVVLLLLRNRIKRAIAGRPDSFYARAFFDFIHRDKIGVIFAFIILLRTGEFMLTTMIAPFFVDLGIKVHYGWLSSAVGLPFSILGAMLGGWMIARWSLKRVMWPFILLQNITNLVYMVLAFSLISYIRMNTGVDDPVPIGTWNLVYVASVHAFDHFAGGLGTAVLMTFLMRICRQEFKAAHYAIGTGFMNISGVFAGVFGGFLCSWFGYGYYFGISFLCSIPAMITIFFLPDVIFSEYRPRDSS